jgi:hypothetical protein
VGGQEKSVNNEHQGKVEWEEEERSLNNEHQIKDEWEEQEKSEINDSEIRRVREGAVVRAYLEQERRVNIREKTSTRRSRGES